MESEVKRWDGAEMETRSRSEREEGSSCFFWIVQAVILEKNAELTSMGLPDRELSRDQQ